MRSDAKNRFSIYFIVPAPIGISPGQRFRFEHYLSQLRSDGGTYFISSFYNLSAWNRLYRSGHLLLKILSVLFGFLKRFIDLFKIVKYDYVFIYREATPVGPPIFEWILARVLRKKIIYDFDDAIWVPFTSQYNTVASKVKNFSKVGKICKWSYKVTVGNAFLADFAKEYNKSVVIIPTVVNTSNSHNVLQDQIIDRPAVGWTGTFSTIKYLNLVLPVLQELQDRFDFKFIVIADKNPNLPLKHFQFVKWQRDTEAMDLLRFHIGLMPLYDDEISKGKCGFKAIQYMSLGIPAVVSPVGVNSLIVDNDINGFVCSSHTEWLTALEVLLTDSRKRQQFGKLARKKIEDHYSVWATYNIFVSSFKDIKNS